MEHRTDSHTADGKRGDDFMISLWSDLALSSSNPAYQGNERPWGTVANYVVNLERRVKALEDLLEAKER